MSQQQEKHLSKTQAGFHRTSKVDSKQESSKVRVQKYQPASRKYWQKHASRVASPSRVSYVPSFSLSQLLPKIRPLIQNLKVKSAQLGMAKETYLTDSKVDLKGLSKEVDLLNAELDILKNMFRSTGKLDTTHITLTTVSTAASGAATAQAPVVSVCPGNSAEFASLAILFDEVICDSCDLVWDLAVSNSNSNDIHAAVAYDPINSGAYTSVVTVIEASQYQGPVHVCNSSRNMQPLNGTPTGMWHKKFIMPKGPEVRDPATASVLGTGQWTSTGVSTTIYGAFKWYVEAASAGLTTTVTAFLRMHCRFRSRS